MTEQRYSFVNDDVARNLKTPIMGETGKLSIGEVLDLLNQLYEENVELRKENYGNIDGIGFYKEENASLSEEISELECVIEKLRQDKGRLIGYLHRYKGVDVEEVDEVVLSQDNLDEWGELYYTWKNGGVL